VKKEICLVIPCFKVKNKIFSVIKSLNFKKIDKVVIVDDKCPEQSGLYIKNKVKNNKKIHIIFLKKNHGVGGATIAGFHYAIKKKYKFVIKLDGDGQHDPSKIKKIIDHLNKGYNYCKGYRSLNIFNLNKMPLIRYLGNVTLTLIFNIISNNYTIKDVTNGFIGIETNFLKKINLNEIKNDYFFEQDLLFNLILKKAKIFQIKTKTIYEDEKSSLKPLKVILPFISYYLKNLFSKFTKN
jgi:dolichol-phosphate mannosyltransferase